MKADFSVRGFLVGMWTILFLSTFGLEVRVILNGHKNVGIVSLLALLFVGLPFAFRRLLINSRHRPKIRTGEKSRRRELIHSPNWLQEAVEARIKLHHLKARVSVLLVPGVSGELNASVWKRGKTFYISLTEKALVYAKADGERYTKFLFVLDHELGHIANHDATALQTARAVLLTSFILIPLKLGLAIGLSEDLLYFQSLLPWHFIDHPTYMEQARQSDDVENFISFQGTIILRGRKTTFASPVTVSRSTGVFLYICFNFGVIFILYASYLAIARYREKAADIYASGYLKNNFSRDIVRSVFYQGPPPVSSGIVSLLFARHPAPDRRASYINQYSAFPHPLLSVLATLILTYSRFLFCGNSIGLPEGGLQGIRWLDFLGSNYTLLIIDITLYGVVAYILLSSVSPWLTKSDPSGQECLIRLGALATPVLIASAICLFQWIVWSLMTAPKLWSESKGLKDRSLDFLQVMYHFERSDHLTFFLSLPVVLLAFVFSAIAAIGARAQIRNLAGVISSHLINLFLPLFFLYFTTTVALHWINERRVPYYLLMMGSLQGSLEALSSCIDDPDKFSKRFFRNSNDFAQEAEKSEIYFETEVPCSFERNFILEARSAIVVDLRTHFLALPLDYLAHETRSGSGPFSIVSDFMLARVGSASKTVLNQEIERAGAHSETERRFFQGLKKDIMSEDGKTNQQSP